MSNEEPVDYSQPLDSVHIPHYHQLDNAASDYEQLFWEPANQEEELMTQLLDKVGLPVILPECVE